ncbi:hypothetical protein ABET51_22390 [Metabacillus fastidiosus]|uniref:hypothetical protein n=1 Tax=Metabacillus fastidiosus TaxID=1458 RepID=UPI002E2274F8|nr:hypothetical protein [Metabacillus fastidiosus]
MKTYDSYVRRANFYELLGMKRKAIKVMKEAVDRPFSKLEIGSGYIYIGLMYRKLRELNLANENFESALSFCKDEQYPYSPNFKIIIKSFVENDESEKALKWLNDLIERESYDRKFSKMKKMKLD